MIGDFQSRENFPSVPGSTNRSESSDTHVDRRRRDSLGLSQYAERQAMGYEKQGHVSSQDEIASA